MSLAVRDVIHAAEGSLLSGSAADSFDSVSIDSRTLRPGAAFFALRGPRFDGHQFIVQAADRGASVLIVDRPERLPALPADRSPSIVCVQDVLTALQQMAAFCRSRSQAMIFGITGSNGKTTTKEMLSCILRQAGPTLSTRGNLNNQIGLPLMLCELLPKHRYAVIEMGTSKKGDMELLVDLTRPEIGLITNVGKDHLEFLGTPDGVLEENRLLFDRLPASGTAVINMDDERLRPLAGTFKCRSLTYGMDSQAAVRASEIHADGETVRFILSLEGKSHPVHLFTTGPFQARNAAAAAAAAYAAGIGAEPIVKGLEAFRPVAMRMQTHALPKGGLLINDAYNANPSSVRVSVESFGASFPERARWLVLGDMRELGAIARQEHVDLGKWLAGQPLEKVYLYGRDTRYVLEGLQSVSSAISVERYRKKRYLIEALQKNMSDTQPAILFKASRSLRLEEVIAPLLASSGATGPVMAH